VHQQNFADYAGTGRNFFLSASRFRVRLPRYHTLGVGDILTAVAEVHPGCLRGLYRKKLDTNPQFDDEALTIRRISSNK